MNFFIKHRDKIRILAIASFVDFLAFTAGGSYFNDNIMWTTAYLFAGMCIITSLICQYTPKHEDI